MKKRRRALDGNRVDNGFSNDTLSTYIIMV